MLRKNILLNSLLCATALTAGAQQTEWYTINRAYKSGIELFEKSKFAAASEQFSLVEHTRLSPSNTAQPENKQITLLKENALFYQAVCALELGNDNAEGLFLSYIREYPSSANTKSAYFQMGKAYFNKANYQKAIEWFTKTTSSNLTGKENAEYRFKLAYSYFSTQQYNNAEPIFAKMKEERGRYQEDAIYYYAYINYMNADYKTALAEFERLKTSTTYQASYPYYISALYFLDKRYDDVLAYTIPAIETIDPKYKPEMYRIVAATYFAKNDLPKSLDYYLKFQALDQGKTQNNQDNYQLGFIYMKREEPLKAIKELERMQAPDVHYQNGMNVLGEAFIKTNNKQAARNAFFRASRLDFDAQQKELGLYNYAKLSYDLDFYSVALESVQTFLKTYPNSSRTNEAKTLLGEVLLSTKNYKEAVNVLETIKEKNPETMAVYQKVTYFRGLEFYNERAFENSISLFMRSQKAGSDPEIKALATYWLAEAMFEVRKYGESVAQFERFLAMPAAAQTEVFNYANYALGYSAFQHESYSKAATYFERFLRGGDKDKNTITDATLRLGDSYFVLKNYGAALAQYNKIIAWRTPGEDYALFQRGMIEGLQNQNDQKIATMQQLLSQYPSSNYSDDAGFEMAYTYFVKGDNERAKTDLTALIEKYPRSSYVPRALNTIGLVEYNQDQNDAALATFQRVVKDYSSTDEAKLALESIKNIYLDKSDANGFLAYANTTSIGNYSVAEQDNITFQAANTLFLRGDYQAAYDAINAYFDKFPKAIQEKHAKFIRAESLVKLNRPDEAIPDYTFILNDWTSDYTERALMSISRLYLKQAKYNEAVVYLKKLETTAEYKSNYGFAINNLIEAYSSMNQPDDVLKYQRIINTYERSSAEDKARAGLFAGKAYMAKGDTTTAYKELLDVSNKTKTVTGAEAKYLVALQQFNRKEFKTAQKTIFDLVKMESHDYWVAKGFLLLAETYVALKDNFQAKSTLQSVIDNYGGKDDVIPTAKARLEQLNKKK